MIPKLKPLLLPAKNLVLHAEVQPRCAVLAVHLQNAHFLSTGPPKSKKNPQGIVAKYEAFLERKYPRVYKLHRMVADGCKWCLADMKTYYRLRRDLSSGKRTLSDLTTNELECYVQTSEEFSKLLGIVVISVMPLTVYAIGFAIVFFPRLILTRHFWTNEQRKEFWAYTLKASASRHYDAILDNLKESNKELRLPLSFEDISKVKLAPLVDYPFGHIARLCMIHRCIPIVSVKRLNHRAEVLRELDSRLKARVDQMDDQQLYMHLFIRRLQYEGKSIPEMRQLLKSWLIASKVISDNTSLMIHAPILCQADGFKHA